MQNDRLKRRNTMATARELLYQTWLLNITVQGGATQPDEKIANGDWIEFQNNAPFPVSITFTTTSGTVFNNIASIPASGGRSTPQQAQKSNVTVNYIITNLNNPSPVQVPYGIEVGTGPMQINFQGGQPNPKTISIPPGGKIQIDNQDSVAYNVSWNPPNSFNPNVNPIQPGMNAVQTGPSGNQAQTVTYTFPSLDGTNGSGTVKVNS
jgi:hypothetical protein